MRTAMYREPVKLKLTLEKTTRDKAAKLARRRRPPVSMSHLVAQLVEAAASYPPAQNR